MLYTAAQACPDQTAHRIKDRISTIAGTMVDRVRVDMIDDWGALQHHYTPPEEVFEGGASVTDLLRMGR